MLKRFLVFSDLHITPEGYDTSILREISTVILRDRPDYIVCTGDLGDFASQNKLVKDRGIYSVAAELTVVMNYVERFITAPIEALKMRQRHDKKKIYKPHIVFCLGNHDSPVSEALTAMLEGLGITVVPHKDFIVIEGICFSHTFDNGISGYPCTSTTQILQSTLIRSISGHSHVRSITEQRDAAGHKVFAIKMPCATKAKPKWAGQGVLKWDRGYLNLSIDTDSDWYQYTFRECCRHE